MYVCYVIILFYLFKLNDQSIKFSMTTKFYLSISNINHFKYNKVIVQILWNDPFFSHCMKKVLKDYSKKNANLKKKYIYIYLYVYICLYYKNV